MGAIDVPADRYWAAQTQRSLHHFAIGRDRMPRRIIRAFGLLKLAAAERERRRSARSPAEQHELIVAAAAEVVDGRLADEFPLRVWQTGSGTQSNMNVNEVIAGRANEVATGARGGKTPIHPNDHVNRSQSSQRHVPDRAAHRRRDGALARISSPRSGPCATPSTPSGPSSTTSSRSGGRTSRTRCPLTLGQEFSGYVAQLDGDLARIEATLPGLYEIALGGTAVGTGLNATRSSRSASRSGSPS